MQIVIGLGFGDEGKGTLIDALTSRILDQESGSARQKHAPVTIVRFNGGPQAAHHVVLASGQSHCFAQFGAGTLQALHRRGNRIPVRTLLSAHMLIEPFALFREAEALAALGAPSPLRLVTIDERCVVVTPFHKILNRMQEVARGAARHGSCGLGVGQAWLDSQNPALPTLRIREAADVPSLRSKLRFLQFVKIDAAEQLLDAHHDDAAIRAQLTDYLQELGRPDLVERLIDFYPKLLRETAGLDDGGELARVVADGEQNVLFEGAQGVLLDAEHGFLPHVTPSRTTCANVKALLEEARCCAQPKRIGVLRAYATRHGNGPFPTEDVELAQRLPESHNLHNPWQGAMRVGWFDAVLGRYAEDAAEGNLSLCLTSLDRLDGLPAIRVCVGYTEPESAPGAPPLRRLPFSASPARAHRLELTQRLGACQPIYKELPGWRTARDARRASGLSEEAEDFVRFIESSEGVGVKVAVVSTGPTAADKLFLQPE